MSANEPAGQTPGFSEVSRRGFLGFSTASITSTALASLMLRSGNATAGENSTATDSSSASVQSPHYRGKARRIIHICLCGGLSHLDSFDYKPELAKFHGKSLPGKEKPETFFNRIGLLRQNDWDFKQRGESGLWVSDLFPHLAEMADELTVIRSMVAGSANHTPATFEENSGFRLNGFPVMGSWISYGLGCETENLPAYVVLPDARGLPPAGVINWSNGFLPAQHQGVAFATKGPAIRDLFPARRFSPTHESDTRNLLAEMNGRHLEKTGADDALRARMNSYQLAARMQLAVPEVTAIDRETAAMRRAYGLENEATKDFGGRCLLARRLLENGVRFVQLFAGGSFGSPRINWDGHEDVKKNHSREAARIDQPVATLLRDLKQRGMLEDTLVLFTSEFGRTPFSQSGAGTVGKGRDHNMYGFSVWLAGAGLRAGTAYGATDETGWKSVEKPVHWHDFHATILHLLGINHERLTFYHNGIQRRLTNVHGRIVSGILS